MTADDYFQAKDDDECEEVNDLAHTLLRTYSDKRRVLCNAALFVVAHVFSIEAHSKERFKQLVAGAVDLIDQNHDFNVHH
jgi:hypothetical protein